MKFLLFGIVLLLSVSLISAPFGIDDPNLPQVSRTPGLLSGSGGGMAPEITPGDIDHNLLSNLPWSVAGHTGNLDNSPFNITADYFFGNGSQLTDTGDDLGNHIATTHLNMSGFNVTEANGYYFNDDETMGFFREGDDQLRFIIRDFATIRFAESSLESTSTFGWKLRTGANANHVTPVLNPSKGDDDTGIGWANWGSGERDVLSFIAEGRTIAQAYGDGGVNNFKLPNDNGKLLFGQGDDASIYYNGSDQIYNSQELGSGKHYFYGDVVMNGSSDIAGFAKYNFTDNNFDGSGNFTTTGVLNVSEVNIGRTGVGGNIFSVGYDDTVNTFQGVSEIASSPTNERITEDGMLIVYDYPASTLTGNQFAGFFRTLPQNNPGGSGRNYYGLFGGAKGSINTSGTLSKNTALVGLQFEVSNEGDISEPSFGTTTITTIGVQAISQLGFNGRTFKGPDAQGVNYAGLFKSTMDGEYNGTTGTNYGIKVTTTNLLDSGSGDITSYGIYIDPASDVADIGGGGSLTSWALYSANNVPSYFEGNIQQPDNIKSLYGSGTGGDASIYYDGTNMKINPKDLGSGSLDILGDLNITQNITLGTPAGADFKCLANSGSQCIFGINATCSFQYSPNGNSVQEVCN